MNAVLRQLVLKDLRMTLPIMVMMTVTGLAALALMTLGIVGYSVGGIMFLTANIAGSIFIGMYCIVQERKEQSGLFALSLPISVAQLNCAKLTSALLIYLGPWLFLAIVATAVPLLSARAPDGMVVYTLYLEGCFLAVACVYFSLIALSRSDGVAGFGILILNMGFSLFMVATSQPRWRAPLNTEQIVWPGYAVAILAVELLVIIGCPLVAFYVLSRRRESI